MNNRELLAKVKQLKCMCNLSKTSDYATAVMVVDALAEFYSLHAVKLLDIIEAHLEEEGPCISAKNADIAFYTQ